MTVFTRGSRNAIDRTAAVVGGLVFLLGVTGIVLGATAPEAVVTPRAVVSTVESTTTPGDPTTSTSTTTEPPGRFSGPRVTEEVTVTEGASSRTLSTTTTSPPAAAPATPFSSKVTLIALQLVLVTLAALFLAFAIQRVLLGDYGLRRPIPADAARIDEIEARPVKNDVVAAGEAPDLSRPLFERSGVTDARLRLLQNRIQLELEVRKLAHHHDLPASLSIPSVTRGLVDKKKMTPKLASGISALSELGDRLGRGAEITPDALILLTESYAQALAKLGGKIKH